MENLFNHTTIYQLVYTGHTLQAVTYFIEQFDTMLCNQSLSENKLFLSSLNFGLYNYILLKENTSLHKCCDQNRQIIENVYDAHSAKESGIAIINSYAYCNDYLIEKYENDEIKKAIHYIHDHLHQKIILDEVCTQIGLNKCYFCTLFKKETNQTFSSYINTARIRYAKKLLLDSTLSLDLVASKCGFQSQAYFCTTFKKLTGISPTQFISQKKS